MNRLWVRLAIAFFVAGLINMYAFEKLNAELLYNIDEIRDSSVDDLQRADGLHTEIEAYYETQDSWRGLEAYLTENQVRLEYEIFWGVDSLGIAIYDLDDALIYNSFQATPDILDTLDIVHEEPLIIDGKTQGYLLILDGLTLETDPYYDDYASRAYTSSIGLELGIWIVTALLSAVSISYLLTRPLNKLANEVRLFDMNSLSKRVPERGSLEIKWVAKAFNEMATALEHAETLRRNMVADVAHELRTPLSLVQGNLRAILDGVYELNYQEILRVYDQTRLLARLVNDLHELAQAEAKDLKLNRETVVLDTVIQDTVGAFQPLAEDHHIQLEVEIGEQLPALQLDRERITQVLHNLLGNALRHTPSGGHIKIMAGVDNRQQLEIIVEDNGEGIPAEHLPYIFNRFYKADKSRERAKGGTGLGLAITRAIVEAHGGSIRALNATEGAKFVVNLPA